MRFLLIILASIIATAVSAPPSAHSGQLVKRLDEDLRGLVPDGQKFEDVVRAKCQRCMGMCLDPELMVCKQDSHDAQVLLLPIAPFQFLLHHLHLRLE